jgi:hypothetical protein
MTPDIVTQLAALAIMQAHIVANHLYDIVIPRVPAAERRFAERIVQRVERGSMLEEVALRDLEMFSDLLAQHIDAGTHVYWQGDENHVRGGYQEVYRETDAHHLAGVASEIAVLADTVLAVLSTARVIRENGALLDD